MATIAVAYVTSTVSVSIKPEAVYATSEATWGSVSVGLSFAFTATAARPKVSPDFASALVRGGNYVGVDLTPVTTSTVVVQSPNPEAPFPSGQQLTFFWSTG